VKSVFQVADDLIAVPGLVLEQIENDIFEIPFMEYPFSPRPETVSLSIEHLTSFSL
jgi:hypothetical protein